MKLADDLRPLLTSVRSIPGQLGLRPYSIQVAIRWYSGDYAGEGVQSESLESVTEAGGYSPKVRFLNDEAIALGNLDKGTIEVGPITPSHTGGGTNLDLLVGASVENKEILHYVVTGPEFPNGASFRKVSVSTDRALHYTVRLAPIQKSE